MAPDASKGRRSLRMTPYLTHLGPRKIGNVPARYTIRCPDTLSNPKTAPGAVAEVKEETIVPFETTAPQEEQALPGCSYEVVQEPISIDNTQNIQSKLIPDGGQTKSKGLRYTYPLCYVEPSRSWTYKSDTGLSPEDEELYYAPDPFRPVPATKGAPCAAIRMHYASARIDSIKYRAQQSAANEAKQRNMESANCQKCNLRFFLPYNHMRSRISYAETKNRYDLPLAFFACPLCHHENQILDSYKDFY